jgi:molybdopterin guanine dinucleotide-containing S/N-oxide reductase-like protein
MPRTVHAACPHDCPDACSVLITVDDLGKATKIQGDPDHPATRGFLCGKVAKYLDRVYSPDRVLYPLRRKKNAPKGGGHKNFEDFERITWDAALDEIATKLASISKEFGSEAILPYSYGGTLGVLGNASMDHRFFHRLGASQLNRTICATAGGDAIITVLGRKLGTDMEAFRHSKYIIAWGANIHGTNIHLWPFIEEARRNGAKLVVIDPYKTRTAALADWYLPINPGTDVALALAMMHVIINENLYDADYVAKYTLGFDELKKKVQEYPPEKVAGFTGISAADIVKLAREYATTHPAAIRVNYGIQRSENGGMAMRAVTMLPCITGAWKHLGGGIQLSTSGAPKINEDALTRPDLMKKSPTGRATRVVNMSSLATALTKLNDPPVKAVFVYNSNPAAVAPNHNEVIRGFKREDLLTVVHEQFLTDTTDYADIVLPATTFFEQKELVKSYGHYYLQMSHQAISPLGEARTNVETFRALALRMGFDDACFKDSIEDMMDRALDNPTNKFLTGIDRERLERENSVRLNFAPPSNGGHLERSELKASAAEGSAFLPFAHGGFETASGKAELYSESLKNQGLDPVATFIPPTESRHSAKAKNYPLEILTRKADNHLNSSFCNLPAHQKMEEPRLLEISANDAAARNIREGDRVRVFNDRGSIHLKARVNGATQRGVVAARLDWAKLNPDGVNVNVLTSEKLTEIGAGATFYSCLVEVEKA